MYVKGLFAISTAYDAVIECMDIRDGCRYYLSASHVLGWCFAMSSFIFLSEMYFPHEDQLAICNFNALLN